MKMPLGNTEQELLSWRYGQTQAERLVAGILHVERFEDVDPQHPLGGPDGIKDVLCTRAGALWVAAAYFPTGPQTFSAIANHPILIEGSARTRMLLD